MQGVLGPINPSGGGPIPADPTKENVQKTWTKYAAAGPDPVSLGADGIINDYVGQYGAGPTQTMEFQVPGAGFDGKYFIVFQEGPADCTLDGNGASIDNVFATVNIPAGTSVKFYWDEAETTLRRG